MSNRSRRNRKNNRALQAAEEAAALEAANTKAEPETAFSAETMPAPETASVAETMPAPEPASAAETMPAPEPASTAETMPAPETAFSAETMPAPETAFAAGSVSEPEPVPSYVPTAQPVAAFVPEAQPQPAFVPTPQPQPAFIPTPQMQSSSAAGPQPIPQPSPVVQATPVPQFTPVPPQSPEPAPDSRPPKKKKKEKKPRLEGGLSPVHIVLIVMIVLVLMALGIFLMLRHGLIKAESLQKLFASKPQQPAVTEETQKDPQEETAADVPDADEAPQETESPEGSQETVNEGEAQSEEAPALSEEEALDAYSRVLNAALEKNMSDHFRVIADKDQKVITVCIWYDGIAEEFEHESEDPEEIKTQKNSWDATKASILTMAVDFYNNRNGLKLDDYHVRSLLLNDKDHNDILLAYLDGALAFDKYESRFSEQDIDEEVPPVIAASNRLLSGFPFSYTGLFARLKFEEFSDEDALYAVENCGADWNEQASRLAHIYADHNSLSRDLLISQLKYEGFTEEQAAYGADSVGLEE